MLRCFLSCRYYDYFSFAITDYAEADIDDAIINITPLLRHAMP